MRQIFFSNHLLHSCNLVSCVPGGALKEYPFWLDHTYHCGITLLGIFTRGFTDRVHIIPPRHCTLSQPILFGLVVTNVTPSYALPCLELKYFSFVDITGFRSPSLYFLTGIILRAPTMGERVCVFMKKRLDKKVSRIIFSTTANEYPVIQVTRWRNIYSDWITRTTAA